MGFGKWFRIPSCAWRVDTNLVIRGRELVFWLRPFWGVLLPPSCSRSCFCVFSCLFLFFCSNAGFLGKPHSYIRFCRCTRRLFPMSSKNERHWLAAITVNRIIWGKKQFAKHVSPATDDQNLEKNSVSLFLLKICSTAWWKPKICIFLSNKPIVFEEKSTWKSQEKLEKIYGH